MVFDGDLAAYLVLVWRLPCAAMVRLNAAALLICRLDYVRDTTGFNPVRKRPFSNINKHQRKYVLEI